MCVSMWTPEEDFGCCSLGTAHLSFEHLSFEELGSLSDLELPKEARLAH